MIKKVLFAVAFVAFATVSCKKDYVCECKLGSETVPTPVSNASKSEAQEVCDELDSFNRLTTGGGGCELK
jgi:hypothetical protein